MDDTATSLATVGNEGNPAGRRGVVPLLASRAANSTTHGLTAKKLLPEILGREVLERHRQKFRAEWQPFTPTQAFLVEELARHAAALERATPIEEAVLRTSACGLSSIANADLDDPNDRVLAAACGSETLDRLTRYRRAHEKAFLAALARLGELRPRADAVVLTPAASPRLRFNEITCLRFLQQRRDAQKARCSSCGAADGKWLVGREHWQCRQCRRQVSARNGTVMARSPLPLCTWFAAIAEILQEPQISTEALCEITGIRRAKTVRALAERIRQAIDSPEADRLLAGLGAEKLRTLAGSRR